jgi:hypothetical protein
MVPDEKQSLAPKFQIRRRVMRCEFQAGQLEVAIGAPQHLSGLDASGRCTLEAEAGHSLCLGHAVCEREEQERLAAFLDDWKPLTEEELARETEMYLLMAGGSLETLAHKCAVLAHRLRKYEEAGDKSEDNGNKSTAATV